MSTEIPNVSTSFSLVPGDLGRRTLRMVGMLVAACVVFVGSLSLVAVAVAGRAVGPGSQESAAELAPNPKPKKPLSI